MQTALRKMGNSTGIIVPKALLTEMGLSAGAPMDVRVEEGRLVATPVRSAVRSGWEEDAETLAATGVTGEERDWLTPSNEGDDALKW